jgi:hypothetical protein
MMSIDFIVSEADRATRGARKNKLQPFVAQKDGDEGVFKMPMLGDYLPAGWEFVQSYFVDSSGFGREDEPALTVRNFTRQVKQGYGYGLKQYGQFQVYVNEFKRKVVKDKRKKVG